MKLLSYIALAVALAVFGSSFAASPAFAAVLATNVCSPVVLSGTHTVDQFTTGAGYNATAVVVSNPASYQVMIRNDESLNGEIVAVGQTISLIEGAPYSVIANVETIPSGSEIQVNYCAGSADPLPTSTPSPVIPTSTPTVTSTPIVSTPTPSPAVTNTPLATVQGTTGSLTRSCVQTTQLASTRRYHSYYAPNGVQGYWALWSTGTTVDAFAENGGPNLVYTNPIAQIFLSLPIGSYTLFNNGSAMIEYGSAFFTTKLGAGASVNMTINKSGQYIFLQNSPDPTITTAINAQICTWSNLWSPTGGVGSSGTITDTNLLQQTQNALIGGMQDAQATTNSLLATSNAIENIPESTLVPLQQTANTLSAQQSTALAGGLTVNATVTVSNTVNVNVTVTSNMSATNDLLATSNALQATGQAVLTPLPYGTSVALGDAYGTATSLVCTREPCKSVSAVYDGATGIIGDIAGLSAPSCSGFITESTTELSASGMSTGLCIFINNTGRFRDLTRLASVVFAGLLLLAYFVSVMRRMGDV